MVWIIQNIKKKTNCNIIYNDERAKIQRIKLDRNLLELFSVNFDTFDQNIYILLPYYAVYFLYINAADTNIERLA